MSPITPLGRPLSQQPIAGNNTPVTPTTAAPVEQPVTAFQWFSLARASWNWIVRPLWYICVKWPLQLLVVNPPTSRSDNSERPEWVEHHMREESQKMADRMKI